MRMATIIAPAGSPCGLEKQERASPRHHKNHREEHAMAELQLRGINKSFGAVQVLHSIDLDIEDGAFVVFVGPSGCGKSTLLRTISGLEEPSAGQVLIGGEDVTDFDPSERGVAMVFQSY